MTGRRITARLNGGWTSLKKNLPMVFLAAAMAALGYFSRGSWERIADEAHEAHKLATDNQRDIAVLRTMERRLDAIEQSQAGIEQSQHEIIRLLRIQ